MNIYLNHQKINIKELNEYIKKEFIDKYLSIYYNEIEDIERIIIKIIIRTKKI